MSLLESTSEDRPRHRATFRFYEELNDFLPTERRKVAFEHAFDGTPAVKDTVEAIGVPHCEIDLILVDGVSVAFEHRLRGGERIAVYPMFERLDIAGATRLRPKPLRTLRFVLDVHLGKLARLLRLLGFDAHYDGGASEQVLVELSRSGPRILLTRNKGLLKRSEVTHGHWLRSTEPRQQLSEVVASLDLCGLCEPFCRCLVCNTVLDQIDESAAGERLPAGMRGRFPTLSECPGCGRLYWPGSHYRKLLALVEDVCRGSREAVET